LRHGSEARKVESPQVNQPILCTGLMRWLDKDMFICEFKQMWLIRNLFARTNQ